MIYGTIHNAGKLMAMEQKWEQKKQSGNILKKELSPEEQQIKMFQEQLETQREGNKYSALYSKMQSGQELSPEEEEMLREHDPKTYMDYKSDQMERKAYEEKLSHCKTKEDAERVHLNKLQSDLSELKRIMNNPNIPKGEKVKAAQRIQGDATATVKVFREFKKSDAYREMPTEEELAEERKAEREDNQEELAALEEQTEEERLDMEEETEIEQDADTVEATDTMKQTGNDSVKQNARKSDKSSADTLDEKDSHIQKPAEKHITKPTPRKVPKHHDVIFKEQDILSQMEKVQKHAIGEASSWSKVNYML